MSQAEQYKRLVEFLTEQAGRNAHVEIGQRATDIPDYDDIIATLDGRLGEPQTFDHPERETPVGYVKVGGDGGDGGRFQFEERRLVELKEHAGVVKAYFDEFYIAVAPH